MKVKLVSPGARVPERAFNTDAGFDLFADVPEGLVVSPGQRAIVPTGVVVSVPAGYYGRIADRSGNAARSGIHVLAGVVDFGYTNQIKVILLNTGDADFEIKHHDRIAQLVVTAIYTGIIEVVEEVATSDRGENGFGSTGQ